MCRSEAFWLPDALFLGVWHFCFLLNDRDALETYIKSMVGGWYHATGTCRMGNDPDGGAVVDGHLRVHGVDALHVVDASVMPTVVRAPTNLSSIAIGERAAELLR